MHKSCEGMVLDGSPATELLVNCEGGCAGATVMCADSETACIVYCGKGEGNCEGLEVHTGNGHLRKLQVTCQDNGCKDLKFVSTAESVHLFILNGGSDGFGVFVFYPCC